MRTIDTCNKFNLNTWHQSNVNFYHNELANYPSVIFALIFTLSCKIFIEPKLLFLSEVTNTKFEFNQKLFHSADWVIPIHKSISIGGPKNASFYDHSSTATLMINLNGYLRSKAETFAVPFIQHFINIHL